MNEKNNDFVNGAILGGIIGVALGMMLAPDSGEKTRELVVDKLHELKDYVSDTVAQKKKTKGLTKKAKAPKKSSGKKAKSKSSNSKNKRTKFSKK